MSTTLTALQTRPDANSAPHEYLDVKIHQHEMQTFSGARNAISEIAHGQSGAGWYVWRWWVNDAPRIVTEKDYPLFGGNEGGAHDLFGPFASEADARECAAAMGTAFRPIANPQCIPLLALPAPAHVVALLPAPAVELTLAGVGEQIKLAAAHISLVDALDANYRYYACFDLTSMLSRARTEPHETVTLVIEGKTTSVYLLGVRVGYEIEAAA